MISVHLDVYCILVIIHNCRCAAQYREVSLERARTSELRKRMAILRATSMHIAQIKETAEFCQENGICGRQSRAIM